MLQGDLKSEPQNQLELKVNTSIRWTTTVNASLEFKRGIYSFSMVIDSFPFFCFENGIIITQRQNSVKNCWENSKNLPIYEKRYFKNKLTYSKLFDHATDDVMSLFWHEINCQVKHYFHANFLCRVIKGWLPIALGLVSRLSRSCSLPP